MSEWSHSSQRAPYVAPYLLLGRQHAESFCLRIPLIHLGRVVLPWKNTVVSAAATAGSAEPLLVIHAAFHVDRRLVCNCLQPQLLISLQPLESVLGVLVAEYYQQLLCVRQFSVGVHRPRGGIAH